LPEVDAAAAALLLLLLAAAALRTSNVACAAPDSGGAEGAGETLMSRALREKRELRKSRPPRVRRVEPFGGEAFLFFLEKCRAPIHFLRKIWPSESEREEAKLFIVCPSLSPFFPFFILLRFSLKNAQPRPARLLQGGDRAVVLFLFAEVKGNAAGRGRGDARTPSDFKAAQAVSSLKEFNLSLCRFEIVSSRLFFEPFLSPEADTVVLFCPLQ